MDRVVQRQQPAVVMIGRGAPQATWPTGKNRGLNDIFVACIDGLSGFAEAIHAASPQTSVQLCIVHLVRAALRYVSSEDSKQGAAEVWFTASS